MTAPRHIPIVDEDLRAHCARELAGYKKPRRISVVIELPRTANGKIDKNALRHAYADAAGVAEKSVA